MIMSRSAKIFEGLFAVSLGLFFLAGISVGSVTAFAKDATPEIPLGLDEEKFLVPKDNPMTEDKINLGRFLFFDKRLSANDTIACATCHLPERAFTDGKPVSAGINGLEGDRNAPTSINRAFGTLQFWDGRAATLEDQSIGPFVNPVEHGFKNHDELVAKISGIKGYRELFKKSFGVDTITKELVGKAIATFQRTLISGNSPFDRYDWEGDTKAISESARRGRDLFFGKARCNLCHSGTNFSDERFHNIGIGWDKKHVDMGRFNVTNDEKDKGSFKTPTLREISHTSPYMHDGRFQTLMEVVEHYNQGGIQNPFLDNQIIKLNLTEDEKRDLIEMLLTLNGEGWQHVKAPGPEEFPK